MILPEPPPGWRDLPVSTLAYIGDAVFELYARLQASRSCHGKSGHLHRLSVRRVSARAQAESARRILPQLSEEEQAVFRRGRNSQPSSRSKHADPADYQMATGLEAVIGYLYLTQAASRLDQLMAMILEDEHGQENQQTGSAQQAASPDVN
jgi:ribonuclease-3 family protein